MKIITFLKPFFFMVLHMSINATVIGSVIWSIKHFLKRYIPYKCISKIWILLLIVLILPISIRTSISVYNMIPLNIKNNQEKLFIIERPNEINFTYSNPIEISDTNTKLNKEKNNIITVSDIISVLWLTIALILFIYMIVPLVLFIKNLNRANSTNINNNYIRYLNTILFEAKEKFKVSQKVKIVISDRVKVPSLIGIIFPKIIVNNSVQSLSEKELRSIVYHEVVHLKRKDNALIFTINVLKCIYFFNPIIVLLLNTIMEDAEIATDEEVLLPETNEMRKVYCKALIKASINQKIIVANYFFSRNRKVIERRINHIKMIDSLYNGNFSKYSSIVIVTLVFLLFGTQSSSYLPRTEVTKLIKKGNEISNYSYEIKRNTSDSSFEIANIKNNIMVKRFYSQNKIIERIIYHKLFDEKIDVSMKTNTYDYTKKDQNDYFETPNQEVLKKIKDYSQYDFYFLGTRDIKDITIYEIELDKKDSDEKIYASINIENGLIQSINDR